MNTPPDKLPATHLIASTPVEYVEGRTWIFCEPGAGYLSYWWDASPMNSVVPQDTHWCHSDVRPTHDPRTPNTIDGGNLPPGELAGLAERLKGEIKGRTPYVTVVVFVGLLTDALTALAALGAERANHETMLQYARNERDHAEAKLATAERELDDEVASRTEWMKAAQRRADKLAEATALADELAEAARRAMFDDSYTEEHLKRDLARHAALQGRRDSANKVG